MLQVIKQMFYKAEMRATLVQYQRSHIIYAFDTDHMRPHWPMESDYAATVGCSYS